MADKMMHKIMRATGYGILFAAVVCIIICAEVLSNKHHTTQLVDSLNVNITGGGECPLADAESIDRWIRDHGHYTDKMKVERLEVGAVERVALSHSAVASANAYVDYDGRAIVDVVLRTPIARLRIDGYDMYITDDGFLLPTVEDRTAAVPVITGSYKPLFRTNYSGYAAQQIRDSIASLERYIDSLEDAKLPYYHQLENNDNELREALSQSVRNGIFMSQSTFEILLGELQRRKVAAREEHNAKKRKIETAIAALEKEQYAARMKQRYVHNVGEDFEALLSFLKSIRNNKFWQAEVVQIMLNGGGREHMEIGFVPRSGTFVIDLGTASELDKKLSNLYRFYEKGLDKLGWDRFKSISLRYDGQVVCR